ncbi:MAG TPA: flagellar assembly protein FliX [Acetobacteraceae bacterium]|nr:flagellar assembly protein FliX [Acetobacteraceae bacterium]
MMTSIRTVGGVGGGMSLQSRRIAPAGGFTVAEVPVSAEPVMISPVVLAGLLSVQDDAAPAQRDRAAKRGADAVLKELSRLQAALLGGQSLSPGALNEALERLPEAASPQLQGILAAIRLRAGIELARRGRFVTTL